MLKLVLDGMLAFFISFSVRTAKIEPNPIDYQFAFGVENKYFESNFEYERENGLMYMNLTNEITPHERLQFSQKYIGIKEIDSQSVTIKQPMMNGAALIAFNTQAWNDPALLVGYRMDLKGLGKIEIKTNFSDRTILDMKLGKAILVSKNHGLFLEPLMVYSLLNEKVFWQAKLRLKLDINSLKKIKSEKE